MVFVWWSGVVLGGCEAFDFFGGGDERRTPWKRSGSPRLFHPSPAWQVVEPGETAIHQRLRRAVRIALRADGFWALPLTGPVSTEPNI